MWSEILGATSVPLTGPFGFVAMALSFLVGGFIMQSKWRSRWMTYLAATALLVVPLVAVAAVTIPYTFTNGTTADADDVNANFQALAAQATPLGTIIPSMLTTAQLQGEYGTDWVLADGSDVTGSDYATLTGATTVPDLRGLFLRGKNNGRADGKQAPADEALGTYTADAFDAHSHPHSNLHNHLTPGNDNGITAGSLIFAAYTNDTFAEWYVRSLNAGGSINVVTGGAETRPRNLTINYFIKINE